MKPRLRQGVKTQMVSPVLNANAQTYVGIVEECEATAVSFTGYGCG